MNTPQPQHQTPTNPDEVKSFLAAASKGDVQQLGDLLENGVDINARGWPDERPNDDYEPEDDLRLTALTAATQHRHLDAVEFLISRGADPDAKTGGATALLDAAYRGHPDVVTVLLDSGADITAKRFGGASALHEAVADLSPTTLDGKLKTVAVLLDRGCDIDTKDELGHTALHAVALTGSLPLVQLLLDRGANINARNRWGDVPLDRAALGGRADVVELLIATGAEVNTADGGCGGLGSAAGSGHGAVVKLLLAHGAKAVPGGGKDGGLELLRAARSGDGATVEVLVGFGFGVQATEALFQAVAVDSADVVRVLLAAGADVEARSRRGQTALHLAVLSWRVSPRNVHGEIKPRMDVVRLLLEKGVDALARDVEGRSAKDLAVSGGFSEAVELLTARGWG